MEEKRREPGSPSPAPATSVVKPTSSPSTDHPPHPPRRRGQKRKSISSSAPPKRHAREKAAAAAAAAAAGISSLIHNGPLTRARQLSDNAAIFSALSDSVKDDVMGGGGGGKDDVKVEEVSKVKKEVEAFRVAVEAEFEGVRARGGESGHVVPVAAGWFSWTNIHPLEKQTLRSFFNGKSESRTPETYLEIRNWIMKKFHANPAADIELKDLSALSVGDSDARQEVMEFLDHWGLINYHPFLQNDPSNIDADHSADVDKAEKIDSLVEKLYRFENEQSCPALVPRTNMLAHATPTGLLRESAIAEEFIKQEGPAVEYHCNSCSADCSRKRYHCQKQADFDLCTECYNNGKFGSGMSSSDFILMEPGEASGATGGKWTDQETLLLLEALELFKENWNEIAEHVATKTKAQCILHFLQMPIEDGFLDNNEIEDVVQEMAEPTSTNNDLSVPKENSEPSEKKACEDKSDQIQTESGMDNSDPSAIQSGKDDQEPSEGNADASAAPPASTPLETSKQHDAQDGKVSQDDDVILKALQEAFDAVGCPATAEDSLSFTEAGNPVMVLAAFLTQLVEPDLATACARSSLKSVSSTYPGSQLAARHCFILTDPPDDKKEQAATESMVTEDQNAMELESQVSENGKEILDEENSTKRNEEKPTPLLDQSHPVDGPIDKKDSNPEVNPELPSGHQDVRSEKCQVTEKPDEEKFQVVENPDKEKCQVTKKLDEENSNNADKPAEEKSEVAKEPDEQKTQDAEKHDGTTGAVPASPKGINQPQDHSLQKDDTIQADQDDSSCKVMVPPSLETEGNINSVEEAVQSTDASKDVDMEASNVVSDKLEQQETIVADSMQVVGAETGEDKMEVDKGGDSKPVKTALFDDDENVAKLKRAALATLSAAAVKAKFLADQEEDEIKQLATALIEKQLRKVEIKLSFFTEMESAIMRVREQLDRSRQKLFSERAQIIASRLGIPASASRASSHPLNRMPASILNSMLRPPMNMAAQRPPMSRPVMAAAAPTANMSVPPDVAGDGPIEPTVTEKSSPVGPN